MKTRWFSLTPTDDDDVIPVFLLCSDVVSLFLKLSLPFSHLRYFSSE